MVNTSISTHHTFFPKTWERISYTPRTPICTSKLQASFPKDQKLLPTSRGEADNCVQKLSCSLTHTIIRFSHANIHLYMDFSGKCQLHRCYPGAHIWECGIESDTQVLSQLWTGIIIIISPSGYICHSVTMVDDSASFPHLSTRLSPFTPFIRKASHVLLNHPSHPHPIFKMKSPDVGDPSVVCVTFLASSLFRAGRKGLIRERKSTMKLGNIWSDHCPNTICAMRETLELAANPECVFQPQWLAHHWLPQRWPEKWAQQLRR